jgi:hypothetical protein
MITAIITALVIPWAAPVSFAESSPGWHTGQSETVKTTVTGVHVPQSTAWTATFKYSDRATADPPNATLRRIPRNGIVVWVSIQPPLGWPPDGRRTSKRLSLKDAYRFCCCEGADVPGGERELKRLGRAYLVE